MELTPHAKRILLECYTHYRKTGSTEYQHNYSDTPTEKRDEINAIQQLLLAEKVEEIAPACAFSILKLTRAGIEYCENSMSEPSQHPALTFNISGNVENSILGNQANAAIHLGVDIAQIKELIAQVNDADKQELSSLPKELSELQSSQNIKKGALARFNSTLQKYPKLFDAVASFLMKFALESIF